MGCKIWWALLPDVDLIDLYREPTLTELYESVMLGLDNARIKCAEIINTIMSARAERMRMQELKMLDPEGFHREMEIRMAENSNPGVIAESTSSRDATVESSRALNAQKSKEVCALMLGCMALAMMLTSTAVRMMSDCPLP